MGLNIKAICLELLGVFVLVYFALAGLTGLGASYSGLSPYIIVAFAIFGRKWNVGHLNPTQTVSLIVSKTIEPVHGLALIGAQLLGSFIAAILFSTMQPDSFDTQTSNRAWETLSDESTLIADNGLGKIQVIIYVILFTTVLGFVFSGSYMLTKSNWVSAFIVYCLYLYAGYVANSNTMPFQAPVNLIGSLWGILFKRADTGKMTWNTHWIWNISLGLVGGAIGGALAKFVVFKDDEAEEEVKSDQSGKQNIVMKQYGDEQ